MSHETRREDEARCELCGEPMPPGEDMFKYHGYSGPCPKPPLAKALRFVVQKVHDAEWRVVENGSYIVARCAFEKDARRVCDALSRVEGKP